MRSLRFSSVLFSIILAHPLQFVLGYDDILILPGVLLLKLERLWLYLDDRRHNAGLFLEGPN